MSEATHHSPEGPTNGEEGWFVEFLELANGSHSQDKIDAFLKTRGAAHVTELKLGLSAVEDMLNEDEGSPDARERRGHDVLKKIKSSLERRLRELQTAP